MLRVAPPSGIFFCVAILVIGCTETSPSSQSTPAPLRMNGADPFVNKDEAERLAKAFLEQEVGHPEAVSDVSALTDRQGVPAVHVVSFAGGGFVLLSADRRVPPVIGYSHENPFSAAAGLARPPNLEYWLGRFVEGIEAHRGRNTAITERAAAAWRSFESEHRLPSMPRDSARTSSPSGVARQALVLQSGSCPGWTTWGGGQYMSCSIPYGAGSVVFNVYRGESYRTLIFAPPS